MDSIIKEILKNGKRLTYFVNLDPVDDIPCEVVASDAISFKSSSSLMLEAFREVSI